MNKSIKKLFVACAAVTAITAVTAMSASADGLIASAKKDGSDNYSIVSVKLASGKNVSGETTIVLLKGDYTTGDKTTVAESDIIYINQDTAETAKAANGFLAEDGVLPSENLTEGETYTVKVADESGAFIYDTKFTVGEEPSADVTYGDINVDGKVNTADANLTLRYATHEAGLEFTETQQVAADVNVDGKINTADANYILRYATHEAGLTLPVTK